MCGLPEQVQAFRVGRTYNRRCYCCRPITRSFGSILFDPALNGADKPGSMPCGKTFILAMSIEPIGAAQRSRVGKASYAFLNEQDAPAINVEPNCRGFGEVLIAVRRLRPGEICRDTALSPASRFDERRRSAMAVKIGTGSPFHPNNKGHPIYGVLLKAWGWSPSGCAFPPSIL